jgi:hypothetical protein
MAYIPVGAKWFLSELVMVITVEGEVRNVVHKNLVLVSASTPEDAHARALALGRSSEARYDNPAGKVVQIAFRGVSKLLVIYEELEHGSELLYEEQIGLSDGEIDALIPAKELLAVFRPIEPSSGPDYQSKEVLEEIAAQTKTS